MFKDLLSMVQGLASGALTLFWAICVFLLMIYFMALVSRELLGNDEAEQVYDYFNSVPRSMFTIFRCSFGDCSSRTGVPIPEYIEREYGGIYGLIYCLFIFFVTIGLFNIISAIFVDSTMSYQQKLHAKKRKDRLMDGNRWSRNVATIIEELLTYTDTWKELDSDDLLASLSGLVKVEFESDIIEHVVHNVPAVQQCLNNLDIDPDDHARLSDILDPDHSGTIHMLELVEGLRRLRGDPRRSDVVSVDLMVRSLQERVDEILERVIRIERHTKPTDSIVEKAGHRRAYAKTCDALEPNGTKSA
jgi:hypothetical protein